MSLDGIRVNHAGLDQAAHDLQQKVREIDQRLDQLERELGPLRGAWAGHARTSYDSAKATWDRALQEMTALLEETGRTVQQSNADYAAADRRGAEAFRIRA